MAKGRSFYIPEAYALSWLPEHHWQEQAQQGFCTQISLDSLGLETPPGAVGRVGRWSDAP